MAMVSPGRMGVGVGWETISLIEGKELKRDFQAVDQSREREREREKGRCYNLIFFSLLNYTIQRNSNYLKGLKKP